MQIKLAKGNKLKRRKFFGLFSKGLAGLYLLNILPGRFTFGANAGNTAPEIKKRIKAAAHPLAVKYGTRKVNVNEKF